MDPKDKKEILDAIKGTEERVLDKATSAITKAILESEERTQRFVEESIGDLARMTQAQFEHMATNMDEIKNDMKEVKTRLTNSEHRGNGQDNLIAKNTDDIRRIKTKVGIA